MNWRRIGAVALLLILLAGATWAVLLGARRGRLEAEYRRLVAKTGGLDLGDPRLVRLRAVPTISPTEFAWQAYLPPGASGYRTSRMTVTGGGTESEVGIVRVAIREDQGQRFEVRLRFPRSAGFTTFGDPALVEFLRGRWEELVVEQAGRGGMEEADPARSLTLLRISLPPAMAAEARAKLPSASWASTPVLFEVKIP